MADRVPVADVVTGLTIHPVDEERGYKLDGAFIMLRYVNAEDGGSAWSFRTTRPGLSNAELLGELIVQVELLKQRLVDDWEVE